METTLTTMTKLDHIAYDLGPGVTAMSVARNMAGEQMMPGPYGGFNACHYVNDEPRHVERCRSALASLIGVARQSLVIPRQTHSANVAVIDDSHRHDDRLDDIDALVTDTPGIVLCINTADCIPLLMADTGAGVIAAVHAGWRGIVAGIAPKAIEAMCRLGAHADAIRAVTGPSICAGCYEVGDEVAGRFDPCHVINAYIKPHIDLRGALASQLTAAGIMPDNIDMSAPCSRCNADRWCSARANGINSSRTLSLITIANGTI